jgi:hypothetical protein
VTVANRPALPRCRSEVPAVHGEAHGMAASDDADKRAVPHLSEGDVAEAL